MGTRISMEGMQLLQLLADRQWHPREDITVKLASMVPPGKALRRYETRERNRRTKYGPRQFPELSDEEKILSGQRNKAVVAINSLKTRYLELRWEGSQELVRVRPTAPDVPGVLVRTETSDDDDDSDLSEGEFDDRMAAGQPATVIGHASATGVVRHPSDAQIAAFFTEPQVRRMIRDEVERTVAQFQQNLQSWLGIRFADLGTRISELEGHRASRRPERPGQRR